jgi:DNA polymerase-3 subunit beta
MKFTTAKSDILNELQLLQGIVEKRNTMPILANIYISAEENEVELIGTDLEVGMKTRFPASVQEPGAVTVSGKKLFEIIRSLAEGMDIVFQKNDDQMMDIRAGASRFKVLCMPKEDYPQVPEPRFEMDQVLPLEKIKEMIDRVYCAITQEQRYYLNGALLILKKGSIELVSTDGHRLAYTRLPAESVQVEEEIRGIVSKKTLGELRKFDDENLNFGMDENNLFFKVANRILISRVIEGKFPNYDAVIPVDNPHGLVFGREEISDAIRRVSLLSTERSRGVKLTISRDRVGLHSSNPELGEAHDEVVVEYAGDEIEIGFNAQYLLDFLSTLKSERVRFELKDENSAVLMRSDEDEEIDYKYVLMPMKI